MCPLKIYHVKYYQKYAMVDKLSKNIMYAKIGSTTILAPMLARLIRVGPEARKPRPIIAPRNSRKERLLLISSIELKY